MNKILFEVKKSMRLIDNVILERGERVYLEFYGPNGYPLCHGYDVAFEDDEFNEYLKEVE